MKNVAMILMSVAVLSACGIKPKNVDAPDGADASVFPRVYPNIDSE